MDHRGRAKGARGVYIAGNALRKVQFIVNAAVAIHADLQEEDIAARVAAFRRGEPAP